MGQITDLIQQYRDGEMSFTDLRRTLGAYQYADPYDGRPADPEARMLYDPPPYTPGSWDEVDGAEASGLLSRPEYFAILREVNRRRRPAPGQSAPGPSGSPLS